jgi:ankyrin repeat protein
LASTIVQILTQLLVRTHKTLTQQEAALAGSLLQPLHMASYNGHVQVVRFLLGQAGVSVNVAAADHDFPLHKACYKVYTCADVC